MLFDHIFTLDIFPEKSMTSVASDLTERIRESLKKRTHMDSEEEESET